MEIFDQDKLTLIDGGLAVDDRGQLTFANNFAFQSVKRFYVAENFSCDTIRAWHGHLREAKYAFVASGSAIVAAVKMTDTTNPDKGEQVFRHVLSARKPAVLYIPAGFANGFRPLEDGTKIMYFSTSSLDESKGDDYRFPADYWGQKIWEIENR